MKTWTNILLCTSLASCGGGGSSNFNAAPANPPIPPDPGVGPAQCANGSADGFACSGLRLRKRVTLAQMSATGGNDIWGWTDPQDGSEYALMGLTNGVSFVNVSDPDAPIVVGRMPTETITTTWRDIKVAGDHAFVVADGGGAHGMQVFDLSRLRGAGTGQEFMPDVVYADFANAHNIAINENSGYAYVVGSNTCAGGLHMIDVSTPINPTFSGCHDADGDTHDAQCVNYVGPDADHAGKEICINSNEDHVAIVDVSTKPSPVTLASFVYPNLGFVHQNWLTEDQKFLFVGDEFDEQNSGFNTRTLVFEVSDLDNPRFLYDHVGSSTAVDHNLYVKGQRLYQANYASGLRILSFGDLATDSLVEEAFFDTRPEDDSPTFNGAWSVYPYFDSGVVLVSDRSRGLFILSP